MDAEEAAAIVGSTDEGKAAKVLALLEPERCVTITRIIEEGIP